MLVKRVDSFIRVYIFIIELYKEYLMCLYTVCVCLFVRTALWFDYCNVAVSELQSLFDAVLCNHF